MTTCWKCAGHGLVWRERIGFDECRICDGTGEADE